MGIGGRMMRTRRTMIGQGIEGRDLEALEKVAICEAGVVDLVFGVGWYG